jgi:hypothetical protein
MGFSESNFSQHHVTDNENCAVTFYPSLLSISLNVQTAVTVQCLGLIDQHVMCGGLTALIVNVGKVRR